MAAFEVCSLTGSQAIIRVLVTMNYFSHYFACDMGQHHHLWPKSAAHDEGKENRLYRALLPSKYNIKMDNDIENIPEQTRIIKLNSIDSFKIINPNIDNSEDNIDNDTNQDYDNGCFYDSQIINLSMEPDNIYKLLLDEIYGNISENNELFGCKNMNISKPDVKYENRKTFWLNYGKNCSQINRSPNQLKLFIEKELAVETSINEKNNLILRGKYNFNLIASTYKKYIKNYVQCNTCKSIQTEIVRNSSNRLDYLKCLNPKCNTCNVVMKVKNTKK